MQQVTLLVVGALALATWAGPALAQPKGTAAPLATSAGCSVTSTVDYRNSGGTTDVEKRRATEAQAATTFTFSNYTSAAVSPQSATSTAGDVFLLSSSFGAQIDGRALIWRQDNAGNPPSGTESSTENPATTYQSQVLLTFSREVSNLTFVIQDIDKGTVSTSASTGGSDYTDEVDFYPLNGAGQPTSLSAANVSTTLGSTCRYIGPSTINGTTQVALRGSGLNGTISSASRAGNATITFLGPVKTILLTYRNLNTFSTSIQRLQTIGFESISWCAQADLTTTLSGGGAMRPGETGQFNVLFSNVGDMSTQGTTATVQLPRNLLNVQATNGGVYNLTTGMVVYGNTSALASYQGSLSSTIQYTTSVGNNTISATATVSTTTDEGLNPHTNTASAANSVAAPLPVALTAFDAQAAGPDAHLTWATAHETNNAYFALERSFDGSRFAELTRLAGRGTTAAPSSYAYTDAGVGEQGTGPVYYRLRQVDLDGTATYSPVRTVRFAASAAAVRLYPNPATAGSQALTLDLLGLPQGDYQASLLDVLGSTVATYTVRGGEAQPVALPAQLAPGTYLVLVQGQNVRLTQRLARQ